MLSKIKGSEQGAFDDFAIWGFGAITAFAEAIDKAVGENDCQPNEGLIFANEIISKAEEMETTLYRLLTEYDKHHGIERKEKSS